MNVISEETWMKAGRRGFRNPKAAKPTPMLSTTSVPTKFCMIVRRQRRANTPHGSHVRLLETIAAYHVGTTTEHLREKILQP
jgi:hypothetical protein